MLPNRIKPLAATLWAALALGGCGYEFAAQGSPLPADARTIYVSQFTNRTQFTDVNDEFMRYLKAEIASGDRLKLVDNPAQADLALSGQIVNVNPQPQNFNSGLAPAIYGQTMTVEAVLKDLHTEEIIWSTHGASNIEHAPAAAQTLVTATPSFPLQNLRGGAIAPMTDIQAPQPETMAGRDLMMRRVAKNLYAEMTEGF